MNDSKLMNRAADNIRILAASMVEKANSGHPGGAMGGADFVNVLFSEFLVYDPQNPRWEGRDRFFLDPGHMSPMLYSVLAFTGKYTLDELKQFRQWGSPTPGHPEVNVDRGVENTSGPLGQGHTYAVGAAIAAKFLKARFGEIMNQTIYAYISDGGIQEEISQGAGRIAGTLGLDNLIMFYDSNDVQLSTNTEDVTTENVAMKYEAWDWKVITINGNDPDEIRKALIEATEDSSGVEQLKQEALAGYDIFKASVINNSVTHADNYITLDKGEADGIRSEMGVVNGSGVVGIVYLTSPHYSIVIPVLNSKSSISCKIKRSDYFGFLKWDGGSSEFAFIKDMPRHSLFSLGDTIVTSGHSAVFPSGIPVGTVDDIADSHDGLSYLLRVKLFTDFARLNDVRVIAQKGQEEQLELEKQVKTTK